MLLSSKLISLHVYHATPKKNGFVIKVIRILDKIKQW